MFGWFRGTLFIKSVSDDLLYYFAIPILRGVVTDLNKTLMCFTPRVLVLSSVENFNINEVTVEVFEPNDKHPFPALPSSSSSSAFRILRSQPAPTSRPVRIVCLRRSTPSLLIRFTNTNSSKSVKSVIVASVIAHCPKLVALVQRLFTIPSTLERTVSFLRRNEMLRTAHSVVVALSLTIIIGVIGQEKHPSR